MKNRLVYLILFATVSFQPLCAKLYIPETDEQFYRELYRHDMAVVHFNPYPIHEEDQPLLLDRMKDAFISLANTDRFKDADIAFIGINLHEIPELADDFNIDLPKFIGSDEDEDDLVGDKPKTDDDKKIKHDDNEKESNKDSISPEEQATLMLFKKGEPLKTDGKIAKRTGFLNKIQMEDFIENYFGGAIDQLLSQKRAEERKRLQARTITRQSRPAGQRRVYRYVYDGSSDYTYRPTTYRYSAEPYYSSGYRQRSYWPNAYYGGYPYGYWPGFGMGFGFGGRRGGFSFGFGW